MALGVFEQQGDPASVMAAVRAFQSPGQVGRYEIVETLVVYYQMETRLPLRQRLLALFRALGGRDADVYTVLQVGNCAAARGSLRADSGLPVGMGGAEHGAAA